MQKSKIFRNSFVYVLREKDSKKLVSGFTFQHIKGAVFTYSYYPYNLRDLRIMIEQMSRLKMKTDNLEIVKLKQDISQVNTSITVEKILYGIERTNIIKKLKGENYENYD